MYYAYKKKVIARSTKHWVHFGINHITSVWVSTLVDIIFVIFGKNDIGILDYNKIQFCVSSWLYLWLIYSLQL